MNFVSFDADLPSGQVLLYIYIFFYYFLEETKVTYLHRKRQEILIEVFRATLQNKQALLVSALLKSVDSKLQSAEQTLREGVKAPMIQQNVV